jgi:hypothetical protein
MLRLDFSKRTPKAVVKDNKDYRTYKMVFDEQTTYEAKAACATLKKDKERICHATAFDEHDNLYPGMDVKKGKPAEECVRGDSAEVAKAKLKAYIKCYNMRMIENNSRCFKETDDGHLNAQTTEDRFVRACEEIVQEHEKAIVAAVQAQQRALQDAMAAQQARERLQPTRAVPIMTYSRAVRKKSSSKSKSKTQGGQKSRKGKKYQGTRSNRRSKSARREYVLVIPKK